MWNIKGIGCILVYIQHTSSFLFFFLVNSASFLKYRINTMPFSHFLWKKPCIGFLYKPLSSPLLFPSTSEFFFIDSNSKTHLSLSLFLWFHSSPSHRRSTPAGVDFTGGGIRSRRSVLAATVFWVLHLILGKRGVENDGESHLSG